LPGTKIRRRIEQGICGTDTSRNERITDAGAAGNRPGRVKPRGVPVAPPSEKTRGGDVTGAPRSMVFGLLLL
jgi:hypothetical protein